MAAVLACFGARVPAVMVMLSGLGRFVPGVAPVPV